MEHGVSYIVKILSSLNSSWVCSPWRDERKSCYVTNCSVGITGLDREQMKRGYVSVFVCVRFDHGQQCVCERMNIYVCCKPSKEGALLLLHGSWRVARRSVHCYLDFQGEATSVWETEMPGAYQDQTPAWRCFIWRGCLWLLYMTWWEMNHEN